MTKFSTSLDGWSFSCQSSQLHEFIPGWPYPKHGVALLWNRPAKTLSLSIWSLKTSKLLILWRAAS